jgi:DNA-directed RNA polymerase omega subunit
MEEKLSAMFKDGRGKYSLVNIIAKRARELNTGNKPMVEVERPTDPTTVAIKEVLEDKLKAVQKKQATKLVDVISRST